MAEIKMVVGLGNPGIEHSKTRHNVGFEVVDLLTDVLKIKLTKRKFGARLEMSEFAGRRMIMLKPWQFMNRSGQAVVSAMGFYQIDLEDLMVVTDDMALEPGRIRVRARGSAGGHNGLADIIEKLEANEFARCRVGIGACEGQDAVDYVLGRPTKDERLLLDQAIVKAKDAVLCWIESGINETMNRFNVRSADYNRK